MVAFNELVESLERLAHPAFWKVATEHNEKTVAALKASG